jgi:hypothetical protein
MTGYKQRFDREMEEGDFQAFLQFCEAFELNDADDFNDAYDKLLTSMYIMRTSDKATQREMLAKIARPNGRG